MKPKLFEPIEFKSNFDHQILLPISISKRHVISIIIFPKKGIIKTDKYPIELIRDNTFNIFFYKKKFIEAIFEYDSSELLFVKEQ